MTPGLQHITVLVADPEPTARTATETALQDLGIGTLYATATLEETGRLIGRTFLDLLIIRGRWRSGDPCDTIIDIRHGVLGPNPFLTIFATTDDPDSPGAWRPIRYGVDAMLPAPPTPKDLEDGIAQQIAARKPFIVTSEYVGPDRRNESGRDSLIPLLDAPNSLRDKAEEHFDPEQSAQRIAEMMTRINLQKLERHAAHLVFLANRVGPDLLVRGVDDSVEAYFDQMAWLGKDLTRRLGKNGSKDAAKNCKSLIQHLGKLGRRRGSPPSKEVGRLIQLATNIQNAISETLSGRAVISPEPARAGKG